MGRSRSRCVFVAVLVSALLGGCGAAEPGQRAEVVVTFTGIEALSGVTRVTVTALPSEVTHTLLPDPTAGTFSGTFWFPPDTRTLVGRAWRDTVRVGEGLAPFTPPHVVIPILDLTDPPPPVDRAPVITELWPKESTLDVGGTATLVASAQDPDGDPLTFSWSAAPVGCGLLSPPTRTGGTSSTTFTASLPGVCTVTVEVMANGKPTSDSAALTVRAAVTVGGVYVPHPAISTLEFLAPSVQAVPRAASDATLRHVWASAEPVTVRLRWDDTPWLERSAATLTDSCGGAIVTTSTGAAEEVFTWTPALGPVCTLTARVERFALADVFPVAVVIGPPPGCAWTPLAYHSLTAAPAGSVVRLSGLGGQGAAEVAGRTAWLQTGDWNVLLVPNGLSPTDDTFAIEVDFHVASLTTYERGASLVPFTTADTAPGPQGTCQFLGGIWGGLTARAGGATTIEWWSAACPNTMLRSSPAASPAGAWHRMRIEGVRSTCRYRLAVDGTVLDTSALPCDPGGSYLNLFGGAPLGNPADVAWSNLSVYRGSGSACVPP